MCNTVVSEVGDWFHFSSYWQNWSRVLIRRGGDFLYQFEVSITPINPSVQFSWETIKEVRIRKHMTPTEAGDIWTHHLPMDVVERMKDHLSDKLIDALIHQNFISYMDQGSYDQHDEGGGVPFLSIVRSPALEFRMSYDLGDTAGSSLVSAEDFKSRVMYKTHQEFNENEELLGGHSDLQRFGRSSCFVTKMECGRAKAVFYLSDDVAHQKVCYCPSDFKVWRQEVCDVSDRFFSDLPKVVRCEVKEMLKRTAGIIAFEILIDSIKG